MPELLPILAKYRGRRIHGFQSEARVAEIVVPELDFVAALADDRDLLVIISDVSRSPEARLYAGARLLKPAVEREAQRRRMVIDAAKVRAAVTGLDSLRRADPDFYASVFDPHPPPDQGPQPARRPPEHAAALRAAQAAAR